MEINAKLLTCEQPSPYTGRVYPKSEIVAAVNNYYKQIDAGIALGELGVQGTDAINLSLVSHKITALYFNDNDLFAKIEFLNTEAGESAKLLMETGTGRLSPVMYATIEENGITATNVGIIKTAIVPKENNND
jgi:hypothetical protein